MFLVQGEDKNFNVYKNIGPEFQCWEGQDKKTNVHQKRARIPVFGRIR